MSFQKLILVTSRLVTKITPLIDLFCHGEWNTRVDPLIRSGMSCAWCHVEITGIWNFQLDFVCITLFLE